MPTPIFIDTGPFVSFAEVDGLEVLRDALDGRGAWTQVVYDEAERLGRRNVMHRRIVELGWPPTPVDVTAAVFGGDVLRAASEASQMQQRMGMTPGARPSQHLGEIDCFLIARHQAAEVLIEDVGAIDYASGALGITLRTTDYALSVAVADGVIPEDRGWRLYNDIRACGRLAGHPLKTRDQLFA